MIDSSCCNWLEYFGFAVLTFSYGHDYLVLSAPHGKIKNSKLGECFLADTENFRLYFMETNISKIMVKLIRS